MYVCKSISFISYEYESIYFPTQVVCTLAGWLIHIYAKRFLLLPATKSNLNIYGKLFNKIGTKKKKKNRVTTLQIAFPTVTTKYYLKCFLFATATKCYTNIMRIL